MNDERARRLPFQSTQEVRLRCLCLATQRAARSLARRFDQALAPFGLTNGQFSMLQSLNRPEPPRISDLAPFLAMDRTTLTAALKVLERRGLVKAVQDKTDKRARRMTLTDEGHALLIAAMPLWREEHEKVDAVLDGVDLEALKAALGRIGDAG